MAWRSLLSACALASSLALVSGAALAADPPDADALFKNAVKDMGDKKFDRACPALRESYKLDPRPVVLFYIADCEEQSGKVATALVTYDDYLAAFDRLSPTEQKEEAQREQKATERREALQRVLPKITLTLPNDAPDGTKLTRTSRDGVAVPVAINVPLPVDPGEIVIHVQAPGRPDWDHRFFVNKGDQKTVQVPVPPADKNTERAAKVGRPLEPVPSYLPPLESDASGQRIAAFVAIGVGAAGILAGSITGAITWGQKGPIEANCLNHVCNLDGQAAAENAKTFGTVSTVTFIVGGVGLAAGAALYFTLPAPAKLSAVPSRITARPAGVEVTWQW